MHTRIDTEVIRRRLEFNKKGLFPLLLHILISFLCGELLAMQLRRSSISAMFSSPDVLPSPIMSSVYVTISPLQHFGSILLPSRSTSM